MAKTTMILDIAGGPYKPGDPAPSSYVDWHDWAEVQSKAGLKQKRCPTCRRFCFPQELIAHAAVGEACKEMK